MGHDLRPEQRQQMVKTQLDQLRGERFQQQMNIARWKAIPDRLRDGSEEPGIEAAEKAIEVIEAQIDALEQIVVPRNRQERRAERKQ